VDGVSDKGKWRGLSLSMIALFRFFVYSKNIEEPEAEKVKALVIQAHRLMLFD
jgi:hypothetical protein